MSRQRGDIERSPHPILTMAEFMQNSRQYASFVEIAPVAELEGLVETFGGFFYVCGYTRAWTDLYVSPGIEVVTGYKRSEFESGAMTFDRLFDPALVGDVRRDYTAQLQSCGRYSVETMIAGKDCSVRWIKDSGVLIRDDGPLRIFGVCLDVSSTAWERHMRLRAEREAERFIAFKTRAVSVLAHEMRTPLNALCGYIDLLRDQAAELGAEGLLDFIDTADKAAHQLTRIAASAIRYAEPANPTLGRINTTLLSLMRDATAMLDPAMRHRIDLRLNEPALGRAVVSVDRVAFVGVFAEILENAAKHAGEAPEIDVDVRVDPQGGAVALFEDNGAGLAERHIADAIAPFFKPSDRENIAAPGIGLGLPRVTDVVRAIGGALYLGRSASGGLGVGVAFPPDDTISAPGSIYDFLAAGYQRADHNERASRHPA